MPIPETRAPVPFAEWPFTGCPASVTAVGEREYKVAYRGRLYHWTPPPKESWSIVGPGKYVQEGKSPQGDERWIAVKPDNGGPKWHIYRTQYGMAMIEVEGHRFAQEVNPWHARAESKWVHDVDDVHYEHAAHACA